MDQSPADNLTQSLAGLRSELDKAAASLGKLDGDGLAGLEKKLHELAGVVSDRLSPAMSAAGEDAAAAAGVIREAFAADLDHIAELAGRVQDRLALLAKSSLSTTTANGKSVSFTPHEKANGAETTVMVDPRKIDADWSKDEDQYLPSGGKGKSEVGGRREGVERFLATGRPVQASRASLDPYRPGGMSFDDGRHRFAVLRDMGAAQVAMTVPKTDAAEFTRRYGSGADTVPAMLAPGEVVLTKSQADAQSVPAGGRVHEAGKVQHFAAGSGAPPPNPGLPNLPPATAQEELADRAKELGRELAKIAAEVAGLDRVSADDAKRFEDELQAVADKAEAVGPILEKLFALDPKGTRALKEQFQAVVDRAGDAAGRIKDKRQATQEKDADAKAKGTGKAARFIESGGGGMSGIVSTVGAAVGPEGMVAAAAINAVTSAIQGATDALSGFIASSVQAANPGVWERYQRSVQDFGAIFGNALTPLIEMMTEWTDKLNGALSQIAPVIADIVSSLASDLEPVINAIVEVVQVMGEAFKKTWEFIGPLVKELAADFAAEFAAMAEAAAEVWSAFQELAEAINSAFAGILPTIKDVMRDIAAAIIVAVEAAAQLLDILITLGKQLAKGQKIDVEAAVRESAERKKKLAEDAKKAATDKTFAARPAEFGSIEDIGKQTQQAFASLGSGPQTKSSEESLSDLSDKVDQAMAGLTTLAGGLFKMFADVNAIAEHIRNPVGAAVKDSQDAIKSMAGGVSLSWDEFKQVAGF